MRLRIRFLIWPSQKTSRTKIPNQTKINTNKKNKKLEN